MIYTCTWMNVVRENIKEFLFKKGNKEFFLSYAIEFIIQLLLSLRERDMPLFEQTWMHWPDPRMFKAKLGWNLLITYVLEQPFQSWKVFSVISTSRLMRLFIESRAPFTLKWSMLMIYVWLKLALWFYWRIYFLESQRFYLYLFTFL